MADSLADHTISCSGAAIGTATTVGLFAVPPAQPPSATMSPSPAAETSSGTRL